MAVFFSKAFDLAEAEAQRAEFTLRFFQRIIPFGMVDIKGAHRHSVLVGITDELCRLVKSHRLAVENSGGKHVGVIAFDPAGNVNQVCKTDRMAFREAITAE